MRPAFSPVDLRRRDLRRLRFALVLLVAVALYAALAWPLRHSITDDTYIHLVYAKHFRDGQGLVFNPGQGVYGTTSPLWSLGLGVLGKTGVDLLWLAHALALLFGALTVVATARFLRRFMEAWVSEQGYGAGRAELAWALATIAFAADAWLVRWSATGMETALAAFLVTSGFASYVGRRPWGNRVLVPAMWWAVAALVRPEAAFLIVLFVLRIVLSSTPPRPKLVRVGWALLPMAVVHGPWLAYALAVYHTPIPATLAAKTAAGVGFGQFVTVMVRELQSIAASRGVELVALVAFLPALLSRFWMRRADHFVPLLWLVGLPLLYALKGVPAISRYLVPILPVLMAYAWSMFAWLAATERARPKLAVAGLVVAFMLSLGGGLYTYKRYIVPQAAAFRSGVEEGLAGLGRWCKTHTPPGTEIAIPDIGAFGYFADRTVVDLAGLVTPAITPLLRTYPYDDLVTNFRFEGVARPPYLIDRADMPRRMLFQSPYAPVLTPIKVVRVDQRGISHPEPAFYTLYKIDWVAFDRMQGGERQAVVPRSMSPPDSDSPRNRDDEDVAIPAELAGGDMDRGTTTVFSRSEAKIDSIRTIRRSFSVRWGNSVGMLLDTAKETYTVDLIGRADSTIAMTWSQAQLDTMRAHATRDRILELPSPYPPMIPPSPDGAITIRAPSFGYTLEIEVDGIRKRFEWNDNVGGSGTPRDPGQWRRLTGFVRFLDKMVAEHPAMRTAPKRVGLYR